MHGLNLSVVNLVSYNMFVQLKITIFSLSPEKLRHLIHYLKRNAMSLK